MEITYSTESTLSGMVLYPAIIESRITGVT